MRTVMVRKPSWHIIVTAILAAALGSPAWGGATSFEEESRRLALIPENKIIVTDSVQSRPEEGKIGYVYEGEDDRFRVCLNDECGPYVDRVARGMPVISPNGSHIAAIVKKDGQARVMMDGAVSRGYDMVFDLKFSPDSTKLAYLARQDDDFFVYVNQERHPSFSIIDMEQGLMFSEDSSVLAYVARKGEASWHMVKNGEAGDTSYEAIRYVTFSPGGERLAYTAGKDAQWHLVEGDNKGPGYDDITHVGFCPNAEHLVYIAVAGGESVLVKNGEESGRFDHIPGEPVFSDDGRRMVYAVAEERRGDIQMRIVVDDEAGSAFDEIGAYLFSPDGDQFAYMAVQDEKGLIVQDGEAHEAYDSVGIPVFDPTSTHLAYMVYQEGKWHIRKNGEKGPGFDHVENPVFCPDGKRMAYIAQMDGQYMVVKDDEVVGTYQWAGGLDFSPDGKHMVYAAAEDGESFLVIDGEKGNERFFSFLRGSPLVFEEGDTLKGIALREQGREFYLIRAILDGKSAKDTD